MRCTSAPIKLLIYSNLGESYLNSKICISIHGIYTRIQFYKNKAKPLGKDISDWENIRQKPLDFHSLGQGFEDRKQGGLGCG